MQALFNPPRTRAADQHAETLLLVPLQRHTNNNCRNSRQCAHCKRTGRHHRSLCPTKFGRLASSSSSPRSMSTQPPHTDASPKPSTRTAGQEEVCMQTATPQVVHPRQQTVTARILFDSGSYRTYITEALANKLGVPAKKRLSSRRGLRPTTRKGTMMATSRMTTTRNLNVKLSHWERVQPRKDAGGPVSSQHLLPSGHQTMRKARRVTVPRLAVHSYFQQKDFNSDTDPPPKSQGQRKLQQKTLQDGVRSRAPPQMTTVTKMTTNWTGSLASKEPHLTQATKRRRKRRT